MRLAPCLMSYAFGRQGLGVADMLATATDLGLRWIEWDTTHGVPADELRRMSDDHGLRVACHAFYLPGMEHGGDWRDEARRGLDAAAALGAPVAMIPTMWAGAEDRLAFRARWIAALAELVPLAAARGIRLTIEHFPGLDSAFITADDALAAAAGAPGVGLTFDCGHVAGAGQTTAVLARCAGMIAHVHLSDRACRPVAEAGWSAQPDGRYYRGTPIGAGDIDLAGMVAGLLAAGYAGPVSIEYEGPADIRTVLREAVPWLRAQEAGR
jgi:inosose dehydratase